MPATYEPIATFTLTSAAIGIEFTNIPQTYTDLVAIVNWKGNQTNLEAGHCRVNGSATNYDNISMGIGATGTNIVTMVQTNGASFRSYGSDVNSYDNFSPNIWHFFSYAQTNINKTVIRHITTQNGQFMTAGAWKSNNAITSIYFASEGFNQAGMVAGSNATLYGIKAA